MEKVTYGGWPNCIKLSNGKIELIATTDVGPRVIRFGFAGGENELHEDPSQLGKTGGSDWMAYGGHRLWHAPEAKPRTYWPDNTPVRYEMAGDMLRLIQDVETENGMQKEIDIRMDSNKNHVEVIHKITNCSLWPVEMAPWALTVMNKGGKAVFPQEPYSPHPDIPDYPGQVIDKKYYLPARNLIMWSYTNLADPRWLFTSKYIILKQDPNATRPQKIGMSNHRNWGAYARNGHLFVKKVEFQAGAVYPDNGCNFETFTNADMLELESLGPMTELNPGATVTHKEDWYLFDNVEFEDTDESIDANVLPKVGG
ncbi:MAG: hypothetical protein Q7N50_02750 [Armatimonadota bacterium]|nr:hypothetical protein [Armatimonadota bacterium]